MNEIVFAFDNEDQLAASKEDFFASLKDAGFDGLEVPVHPDFIGVRGIHDLAVLKGMLADHNLSAPVITTFWGAPCEPMDHQLVTGMLNTADGLTSLMHPKLAVVRLAGCPDHSNEEALKDLAGTLIMASNHFDPDGIQVALEFKNAGPLGSYWHAMDWLYLHNPQVGLAVDTEGLAEGEAAPYRAATEMGKLIRMVYLTEPLSSKRFNHRDFFSGLKTAGFSGPLAIRQRASLDSPSLAAIVEDVRQAWEAAPVEAVAVTEA